MQHFGVCLFSESVKGFLAIMCKLFLCNVEEAMRGAHNNYINLRVLLEAIAEDSVFHNHMILRQKEKDRTRYQLSDTMPGIQGCSIKIDHRSVLEIHC